MSQVAANAIVSAASYILVGIGFSLVYTTGRFFNFAHGAVITLGAYAAYISKRWLDLPLSVSILCGILVSVSAGLLVEWAIYRPLRDRDATAAILLLASLAVYVGLQAVISLTFGATALSLRLGAISEGRLFFDARVTTPQLLIIGCGVSGCLSSWLFLHKTFTGKLIRAVGCDPELARIRGCDVNRVIMKAILVGSSLAGLAGILFAYDTDLSPFMGFQLLLGGVLAVIIGGVGNIAGIVLGALMLAFLQHFAAWWISSSWQDVIVYVLLIIFLTIRPQGVLGILPKSGAV